jgi:hypothetical protein
MKVVKVGISGSILIEKYFRNTEGSPGPSVRYHVDCSGTISLSILVVLVQLYREERLELNRPDILLCG